MAVEKAAIDYSMLPAMTEARQNLEKAIKELDTCFKQHSIPTIKRRLKKAKGIKWPQIKQDSPQK